MVHLPKTPRDFFASVEAGVSPAQHSRTQPTRLPPQSRALDLRLIGSLQSNAVHLKTVLADYEREHQARPTSVLMCIGPEGDFTPAELNLARSNGCRPINLGPIILRVETAAIYCLSVLSYELLAAPRGTQA
jgi:RsmE family RNA methyltransferase